MSGTLFLAPVADLVIPIGTALSNIVQSAVHTEDAEKIIIFSPAVLDVGYYYKIEVCADAHAVVGSTWAILTDQDGFDVICANIGRARSLDNFVLPSWRLRAYDVNDNVVNVAADRTFKVHKSWRV